MASDFIGIDIQGLPELRRLMDGLADDVIDEGVDEASKYMLNVMRGYPPYKYVPFKKAYGGWFSERQRRYVMARINDGSITPGRPQRTQRLSRAWRIEGKGKDSIIVNETPYATYVQGPSNEQARMPRLIGWDNLDQVIRDRTPRIIEKFTAAVNKVIRRRS